MLVNMVLSNTVYMLYTVWYWITSILRWTNWQNQLKEGVMLGHKLRVQFTVSGKSPGRSLRQLATCLPAEEDEYLWQARISPSNKSRITAQETVQPKVIKVGLPSPITSPMILRTIHKDAQRFISFLILDPLSWQH